VVNGTLTLTDGQVINGTVNALGNVLLASPFAGGNTNITLGGSADQTFANNGGVNLNGNWTVNKSSGRVTLLTDLILGTNQSINITSGELNQGSGSNLLAGAITVGVGGIWRDNGTGDIILGGDVSNAGTIDLDGGTTACGEADSVLIRSTDNGTQRQWTGSGTFKVDDVDVMDQAGTAPITAFSATNSGNNGANWTFNAGCSLNSIQFSSANYSAGEGAHQAIVTITRTGDTSGPVTVNLTTNDQAGSQPCGIANGAASSRCDYENVFFTLHFATGETSKPLSVLIVDDSYLEGTETFTLSLSNPSGAQLGANSTATITITDNEIATGPNPIDTADFFVRQHYLDFFTREPDAPGLAFWTGNITGCGADPGCIEVLRNNVSGAFYLSIEFQQTGYLVERMYKAAYGDANGTSTIGGTHMLSVPIVRFNELLADTQQIGSGVVVNQTGWEQVLENNKVTFTNDFAQRTRFTSAFPLAMTPTQFVDQLNTNAGNPLSTAERNQLIADLTGGAKTRAQVLRAVAEDSDLANAEFNRAFVLMQYFGYLRRNPNDAPDSDHTGFDFWLTKLNQFNGDFIKAEMVKAFISSTEYRQRFGP